MFDKKICFVGAAGTLFTRGTARFFIFLLLWYALAGDKAQSWIIGLPVILLATFFSLLFASPCTYSISPFGFILFIPFFLKLSFLGGCDVMRRAFDPRMPMNPGLVIYNISLPQGPPQVLLVNCISLLPGTISADLQRQRVTIHSIDKDIPVWASIHLLERKISRIFQYRLSAIGEEE
ncbi:MAG: Na+/H+ antiporter subunit E [Pseudomonadota bacterium]